MIASDRAHTPVRAQPARVYHRSTPWARDRWNEMTGTSEPSGQCGWIAGAVALGQPSHRPLFTFRAVFSFRLHVHKHLADAGHLGMNLSLGLVGQVVCLCHR